MANYQTLKAAINAVIKANGNKEITGTVLNEVLLAMVNSLGAGYQFVGVATPDTNPGTPDQKVFYIASEAGTYTNFGGAVVSDGIAFFEWNGTWTTETLDLPVLEQVQSDWTEDDTTKKSYIKHKPNIPEEQVQSDWTETDTAKKSYIKHKPNIPPSANVDPVPTEDSPNAVSSGGTYNMIVSTAATLFGNIQDATNVNATLSEDGKIYNDYNAGDIFYIEQDDVRKYRVAYAAGTADAEHPVTINGTLFYYADNASDAIWLSLRIKTVSTEQQSLSAQQKAQARTNIAAVSYDQQSLNAEQQVQAQNNMMGKAYSSAAADHSGLGKVYLDKNNGVLTQSMMQATNTVYIIQYDYTLAANITIPAGCTLQFDGGSISGNGNNKNTITGQNTCIRAKETDVIFTGIKISGTWNTTDIYATWFSDVAQTNVLKQVFNLSSDSVHNNIYFPQGLNCSISASTGEEETGQVCLKSNTNFYFDGTISLEPNSLWGYRIVEVREVDNVLIKGNGTIIGDKDNHTMNTTEDYKTNEWCYGLYVGDSQNVVVDGVNVRKCVGDCIMVSGTPAHEALINNYILRNFTTFDSRRQGLSIELCDTVLVENFKIDTVNGVEPGYGIDIEPGWYHARNITIKNGKLRNCNGGTIMAYGRSKYNETDVSNIYIENVDVKACRGGMVLEKANNIVLRDIVFNSQTSFGFSECNHCLVDNCIDEHTYGELTTLSDNKCNDIKIVNTTFKTTGGNACHAFIDNCLFVNHANIANEGCEGLVVQNSIFVNSAFSYTSRVLKDIIIKDCIIYANNYFDNTWYYFIDAKGASDNISLIRNKFILSNNKLAFEFRSAIGYIELIDNTFFRADDLVTIMGYIENSSYTVLGNKYNSQNLYSSTEVLDPTNVKVTYNGSTNIPQYLLDLS